MNYNNDITTTIIIIMIRIYQNNKRILMNPNPIKNAEEVVRNYEQEQEHTHIVN